MPEPLSMAILGGGIAGLLRRFLKRGFAEVKRTLDIIGASILLIVLGLVILFFAALVKLTSRGPAFYTQVRVGKRGRLFNVIKLRTMRVNAENNTGPVWAKEHDFRTTWLGSFLRKTHIDELPQLINVLRGDMSLIGPRPERPFFVNQFRRSIPRYEERLTVRPGITGLAQVKHKYDETIDDVRTKLSYDLAYVNSMSWRTDIKIALWTFKTITGKNGQ
ncbi:MAG TPA: sugar transferase [Planctomycetota bacterium]|nr:sugar transferase [Planctomycetota bacterium]